MGRTLLLVATGLASLMAALAPLDAQANLTPGVSATWRTVDSSLVGIQELPYSRLIHSVFELRGDKGGEKAYLSVSWHERRFSTKKAASCGGLRYVGRYVIDSLGNAGDAWFGLEDRDGTAHLTVNRMLAVYPKAKLVGPPLCVEATGTWSGSTGVLGGYEGTFRFDNDGTLTLR
jgi:hypothetical protein